MQIPDDNAMSVDLFPLWSFIFFAWLGHRAPFHWNKLLQRLLSFPWAHGPYGGIASCRNITKTAKPLSAVVTRSHG